ncbi:MAG: hypothetical protein KC776_30535 [Myxococcales bacterium]|nr:hypothetical protein [Myxococcales bacterium]MCB9581277.1 hypothetical protein [Polyangiaceae bacterium]
MIKRVLGFMLWALLVACSGGTDDGGGAATNKANPCATPGATYLVHCSEQSGDCGSIPDSVTNIGSDGTVANPIKCARIEQDGCTARDTDCKQSANGCNISSTFKTTFAQDGSSATSLNTISVTCSDGSFCTSTYACTLTRQ